MPREDVRALDKKPAAHWVGLGLKGALLVLLLLPLLQPGLEQYEGKGMSWRIFVFPLACFAVPLLWRATGSRPPYPYLADNLLVLAPLTDVLWNTLDTYDRVWGWDKVNHLGNSFVFAAVIGLWVARYPLGAVSRFALALGLGMTLQVLWEMAEYASFAAGSSAAQTWGDTIGDFAFDLAGSLAGAAFALVAARGPVEEESEPELATVLAGP